MKNITKCQLDNTGRITTYDGCCDIGKSVFDEKLFRKIGVGSIYSVSGQKYRKTVRKAFYVERDPFEDAEEQRYFETFDKKLASELERLLTL